MKRMITTILLLLLFVPLFSQDRTLEKVDENVSDIELQTEGSIHKRNLHQKRRR